MTDPADNETIRLLDAERDVQAKLGDRPLNFPSLDAVSNIYRAAAAVRRKVERELLAEYGLSFGGLTILWVLWVWDEMETAKLADECGLAKPTLTGMLGTLEKRSLVERVRVKSDRRRVMVHLTPAGTEMIDELFPRYNDYEVQVTDGLTTDEKQTLARLLRVVIRNAEPKD